MAGTYETVQGDTWDKIAYQVYGDEKYAGCLLYTSDAADEL